MNSLKSDDPMVYLQAKAAVESSDLDLPHVML
jgi:hypothetical protein